MYKNMLEPLLNFLFPPPDSIGEMEDIPPDHLIKILPQAETTDTNFHSIFMYQDEKVKQLVWEIKYYRNEKVARQVGRILSERINAHTSQKNTYSIVPIPLTAKRLRERGFNHTELIARSTITHLPNNFSLQTDMLAKIRHTPKQNSIENRADRFSNIHGAFACPSRDAVCGKSIIIIDDVITTGATILEAKRTLLDASAAEVLLFSIAH